LTAAKEAICRRSTSIAINNSGGVLECPGYQGRLDEHPLAVGVICKTIFAHIKRRPVRRNYNDLGARENELSEGFWEGKIPADEDTDSAERGVDDLVGIGGSVIIFGDISSMIDKGR
jgi:hypothetical protein